MAKAKAEKKNVVTDDIRSAIETLGGIEAQIAKLELSAEPLRKMLREDMPVGVVVTSGGFSASVREVVKSALDVKKVFKELGDDVKALLKVATVTKTSAKLALTTEQMDRCSVETGKYKTLTVTPSIE